MWSRYQVQYLSSVEVTQILVISNGEIVERGTYPELLKLGGMFSSLVDAQRQQQQVQQEGAATDADAAAAVEGAVPGAPASAGPAAAGSYRRKCGRATGLLVTELTVSCFVSTCVCVCVLRVLVVHLRGRRHPIGCISARLGT